MAAAFALAFVTAGGTGSSDAGETPPRELGGIAVGSHCKRLGFDGQEVGAEKIYCQSPVDLKAACKREWATAVDIKIENGPYSGRCVDAAGVDVGDISDMLGHCRETLKGVRPEQILAEPVPGERWHCRLLLDLKAVCAGQHNVEAVKAANVNGTWRCYGTED
ncbi:hypothetical protein AB0M02_39215 [Actinoplanes sp. NPDC051861]|uniref:hypothetical protein n=1 Tax=Actinoplanes sp. NPDC051861 TaxID=3155170 RepID=UPI003413F844